MKNFKKIRLLWSIPLLIILFLIACPLINDMTASSVAKEIWETPLPPQTERIEKISRAGKLVGNGNGMQFFGAILMKSSCSLDELKNYYFNYSENEWSYVVEEQKTSEIEAIEHGKISFESALERRDYFVVYSGGGLGCHLFASLICVDINRIRQMTCFI